MQSTRIPLSNEKQRVDLPTTVVLYPSGTTVTNEGKPLVFHPVTGKMSIGEFIGGETIQDFTRTGSTLAITTDKATFALDLSEKRYQSQVELLVDPTFTQPLGTNNTWYQNGGWANSASGVTATNGNYLYQDFFIVNGGSITLTIVVTSVISGSFGFVVGDFGGNNSFSGPPINQPGTYIYTYNTPPQKYRIQLVGNSVFNGIVNEIHVYQNGILIQDAYDANFFHKTGDESGSGNKTFTGSLNTPVYKLDGAVFASITSLGTGNGNILYVGNFNDKLSLIAYNTVRVISSNFVFEGSGTGKEFIVRNSGEVTASGYITATGFIGDGSQLTNLPAAGSTIKQAVVFTATANGAQTIPLGVAATGLVSVTCLETGTNTATRVIWESFCTIAGTNLQITPDATIKTGDKISIKYYL